jgi:polyisoprenoid-binding protein YceI
MNKIKHLLIIALSTLYIAGINAQTFNINNKTSSIEWVGKKIGGQHNGEIKIKSGSLTIKDNKIESGNFTMDMNSITCADLEDEAYNNKLVGHLKSDDFFGINDHPESSFIITNSTTFKDNKSAVKGNLTIKGITEEILFFVERIDNTFKATIDVDRSKHNVRYGSNSFFDNLGNAAIDDVFNLNITLITNNL